MQLQAGPQLPASPVVEAGPKFPSRDGSETRTGDDFFGTLPGVEQGGAVEQGDEASSSSPALETPSGQYIGRADLTGMPIEGVIA